MRILLAFIVAFCAKPENYGLAGVQVAFLLGWKAISVYRDREERGL